MPNAKSRVTREHNLICISKCMDIGKCECKQNSSLFLQNFYQRNGKTAYYPHKAQLVTTSAYEKWL
jgi:hypothetical protein